MVQSHDLLKININFSLQVVQYLNVNCLVPSHVQKVAMDKDMIRP